MSLRPTTWLRTLVAVGALGAALATLARPPRRRVDAGDPRNVVLITIDTLRADHVGAYGYTRATTPRIDALARRGIVFEQAFTFWPKTRGSMICMLTGLYPSRNGYDQAHRDLYDFNPTLASVLREAGFTTAAMVDNANVSRDVGFGRGFERFSEAWTVRGRSEADNARAISDAAIRFVGVTRDGPFFLWLHYVNPHAPYTPPPPYDSVFDDAAAQAGPALTPVVGFHGGLPRRWARPGRSLLGYYVGQYDGEIAFVDGEVGRVLDGLASSGRERDTVVVLSSDHGESLGEHDYYFDHGEDLFDPCLHVPLIVSAPGGPGGLRSATLASTLDIVPTILDAVKVRYPPNLAGASLWPAVIGAEAPVRERLYAENDRGLVGTHDGRFKLVETPSSAGLTGIGAASAGRALYDRGVDRRETRDVADEQGDELARQVQALEGYRQARSAEWEQTRPRSGASETAKVRRTNCENELRLYQLGYIDNLSAECGARP
jgi:arylsulfatase A-like enzyme